MNNMNELETSINEFKKIIIKYLKINIILEHLSNFNKRINISLKTYSCDVNKNINCNKRYCSKNFCTRTTQFKYAKKTPLNFIKKIINKLRGVYKYE